MKVDKIYVESDISQLERTKAVLQKMNKLSDKVITIDKYTDIFEKVRKPYLHKRTNLNVFLAHKKGQLVKEAPDAYGLSGDRHFYFIHAYNCIYECSYCYLQGYFNSPDLVLFLNHNDIAKEIIEICHQNKNNTNWFHAGEFSDSLAVSHLTGEIPFYYKLFSGLSQAKLELRSKSSNIKEILKQKPLSNVYVSFSLSTQNNVKDFDLKTPSLKARLKVIKQLQEAGHQVALHFDPVIYTPELENEYGQLFDLIQREIDLASISYISLGVVRFTKDVFHQVSKNYPESKMLKSPFVKSFDQKMRYSLPMRKWILETLKSMLISRDVENKKIYLCME